VLGTIVDQVEPLSVERSILYPVGRLEIPDGAVHDRLICDTETALAVRPVGTVPMHWAVFDGLPGVVDGES